MWGTFQCHTKLYHTKCAFHPPLQMGAFRHNLVNSVYWKTRGDNIDLSEKRELEDFVREGLEEEITGEETDQELESLVQTLIHEWFEED
jgi:hypothetical protein